MTTCPSCGRDRPGTDTFCRYCGVEVAKPEPTPWPRGVRIGLAIGATVLLVGTGVWIQTRPTPMRPSEVSGSRATEPTASPGPPASSDDEAAFTRTEALLSAETGALVVIPPEMTEAIVLSGTAPLRRIALPPATHWEITDHALVGYIDDVHANVMRFSAPGEFTETKAANVYTDLNGELLHTWQDGDRIRVLPMLEDAKASGGDFSASARIVWKLGQGKWTIAPLLTVYQGNTYGWSRDGEWAQVAAGTPAVATDPAVITTCDNPLEADAACETTLVNLRSGEQRSSDTPLDPSGAEPFWGDTAVVSPDLARVFYVDNRTLVDTSSRSALALSVPARSWDPKATWSLDSSILGVHGDGLRLFTTSGAILADVIPSRDGTVAARFVPDDAFGEGR